MKIASWDLIPGIDVVARATDATWFEWDDVSRPFHLRWAGFYQWHCTAMALKPSPYQAVQGMKVAEELIKEDPENPSNPFHWDEVRMNLPGATTYIPALPMVSKDLPWREPHHVRQRYICQRSTHDKPHPQRMNV
jgi:hypothetical protein